eukprot:gb/GFBE01002454.1/.p1 GENE.gb/GFBE01002454.1/~~gb/GFBE01002454.1/.p1  ORF type:complete len:447 (+),score=82.15 gb/GFBE01002454.1/:1-1341(+)
MGCITSKEAEAAPPEYQFYSQYKLGKKLGEGAFGQVRLVTDRSTHQEYAVKIVDVRERDDAGVCSGAVSKSRDKVTKAEVELWGKACSSNCPYIVQLHKTFSEKSLYYMVCEKCECSFMDRLVEAEHMSERDLAKIFKHMLEGISHTHAMGIVHRDVKPDNFLWGGPGSSTLKLCDYGLAVLMPKTGRLNGVFGTAPYMAPEMLKGDGYDYLVDVWSVGAVAYLLVFGSFPYSPPEASAPAMKQAIISDNPRLHFPAAGEAQGVVTGSLSGALDFTKALLLRDAGSRPSAAEGLRNPFLLEEPVKAVKVVVVEPDKSDDTGTYRQRARKARTLTQKLKQKPSPTVQNGIDDLLKKLVSKTGGDASGSNLFFSEGDNANEEVDEDKTPSAADSRVKKLSSRRDVKHSTHSGVIADKVKSDLSAGGLVSPRQTSKSADAGALRAADRI